MILSHVIKHQLSSEKTLEIYYCFSIEKPSLRKKNDEKDWIWKINSFDSSSRLLIWIKILDEKGYYGVSLFNKMISIYDKNDLKIAEYELDGTMKGIKILPDANNQKDAYHLVAGFTDQTLAVYTMRVSVKTCRLEKQSECPKFLIRIT